MSQRSPLPARDRPIMFSSPMLLKVKAGEKTQTRRLITQPLVRVHHFDQVGWEKKTGFTIYEARDRAGKPIDGPTFRGLRTGLGETQLKVHYAVGDRLWVKEGLQRFGQGTCQYVADITGVPHRGQVPGDVQGRALWQWRVKRLPSMYMPRWASRFTLEITDLRVHRVREITLGDAIAEGFPDTFGISPWGGFLDYWNELHGEGATDANPWVVAITFKRVGI